MIAERSIVMLLALAGTASPASVPASSLYLNAEVASVDVDGRRIVLARRPGERLVLPVERRALDALPRLSPGDQVIVSCRASGAEDPLSPQAVTDLQPVPPVSGRRPATPSRFDAAEEPSQSQPQRETATSPHEAPAPPPGGVISGSAAPSPAPTDGIPLWVVTRTIPSLPPPEPSVIVVVPPLPVGGVRDAVDGHHQALQQIETAAAALAIQAGVIDRRWLAFRSQCLPASDPWRHARDWLRATEGGILPRSDDACRAAHDELTHRSREFREQVGIVASAARAAGLSPGRVRETLQRHGLER